MKDNTTVTYLVIMKVIVVALVALAILQGCNGVGRDSDDPGTAPGNDTITTTDRYGGEKMNNDIEPAGEGNTRTGQGNPEGPIDSSVYDTTGQ